MGTTDVLLIILGGVLLAGISHVIDCHMELKKIRVRLDRLERTGRL